MFDGEPLDVVVIGAGFAGLYMVHRLRETGYATRLLKAGVPVRSRRFDGQMHGFFTMTGLLPGADAALDYVTAAVGEVLAPDRVPA